MLEIIRLSEVSETKTNTIGCHLYVESKKKKKDTNELISKWKEIHQHRKQTYGYQRKKGVGERDKLGGWHVYTTI